MKKNVLLLVFVLISSLSFGQIFITEIADPIDKTTARYVELFNVGESAVDLTGYGLQRYTNGSSTPQPDIWALTGTLAAKGFYIVAIDSANFNASYGFDPNMAIGTAGPADSNGDDQIQLVFINTGIDTTVIDIFGVPGEDGNFTCHGFFDGRVERIATVTTGNGGTWNEADWNVTGTEASLSCTNHITGSVSTTDGIFDPGKWIGYIPLNTILSFELVSSEISEDGTSIDVCVSIENPDASNATTVELDLDAASTAINGTDFLSITFPQTISFPAGSSVKQCFTITITDDSEIEVLDETVILILQNPAGGNAVALGTPIAHTISILDNDIVCPAVGDIILTEIMQNPAAVSDANGEYFEIYNTTGSDIDLLGIEFADDISVDEKFVITSSLIIPANGYLLFAINGDVTTNGGITPDYVYPSDISFTLANSTDGIQIKCSGTVIDKVIWDDGVTFPDPNGASMSLKVDFLNFADNDNGANWEEATAVYGNGDLGTPGFSNVPVCDLVLGESNAVCDVVTAGVDTYTATLEFTVGATSSYVISTTAGTIGGDDPSATATGTIVITGIDEGTDITVTIENSAAGGTCNFISMIESPICFTPVCADAGSVIFSEIMQNPSAVTDDLGEWFELYNTTETDIDIQGWSIIDDDHTLLEEGFTFPNSMIIPAGGYLLIATNGDAGTNGGLPTPDYVYNYENLTLGNGLDGLTIQCSETLIDAVVWDDGVTFPDPNGASMSLNMNNLNATDNDAGTNWNTVANTYGNGDFGTPGSANIPVGVPSASISGFTIYPNPVNDGVFRVSFSKQANRSIKIFNLLGKQVYVNPDYKNENINVSDLSSGIYFLRVEEEGKVNVQKFVIQK